MFNAFSTALSALNATATAVDIVGNNLANLNTTGYKSISVEFSDLMTQQMGASSTTRADGLGVGPAQAVRQFTQGAITQSAGGLNAAIRGDGFFVVRDGTTNQQLYTRAGNFTLDSAGNLLTASGQHVQGWSANNGVVNSSGATGDILIPVNGVLPAVVTTTMSATVNLNASSTVGANSGTYTAPIQVVDSLGGVHTLTITFTKTDVNKWDYAVTIPDADLSTPSTTPLAEGSIEFDGTGVLTSPAAGDPPITVSLAGLANGADDMDIDWNLFNAGSGLLTQFAQTSGVSATEQNGITAGQIAKVAVVDGGLIVANYSNGQQLTIGQLALATIKNPESMLSVGNNSLQASADTSAPAIGTAESGGRGQVLGGALESSTVDIATQFTHLITFQRSYQASSRVITTVDQMTQDLIGLVR